MRYLIIAILLFGFVELAAQDSGSGEFIYSGIHPEEILNSKADEFAPSYDLYRNIVYFNSTRGKYSEFYSTEIKNGAFSKPQRLTGEINKPLNNQSYISLVNENQAVYSTFSQKPDRSVINLFSVYYKNGKWTGAIPLDSISGSDFSAEAAISPAGNYLVFVSDRNHSGNTDLWSAALQDNGSWGEITPLEMLNSPGNEMSPYFCGSDTLYFASDGLGGPGGFDIYRSIKIDGEWQRPFPLSDINTEFDESDFILINDTLCMFSSNRPGGAGGFDIYSAVRTGRQNVEIEDTDFDLSLSSTVHLINVDYRNEVYYSLEGTEIIEKSNVIQNFSPDDLDMQIIIRPDGSFISAKTELLFNDKLKKSIQLNQSKSDFKIDLNEILSQELPDAEDVIRITTSAISRANFSIQKNLEINFSRKETQEKQPVKESGGNFGVITLSSASVSAEESSAIIKFLQFESAHEIIISGKNSAGIGSLSKMLSAVFKNIKENPLKQLYRTDSELEIYFR